MILGQQYLPYIQGNCGCLPSCCLVDFGPERAYAQYSTQDEINSVGVSCSAETRNIKHNVGSP